MTTTKHPEQQYLDLMKHVLETGTVKTDRTGTGTKSVFGYQMRFDLSKQFPLLTTKKVHVRSIFHELLWFLSGDTNIKYLKDNKVTIWDEWATDTGDLGPVYGKQWRSWETPDGRTIDQIKDVIELIKKSPDSRRLVVSAWNPSDLPDPTVSPEENALNGKQALPPCHCLFQFYVTDRKLSCQLYQRSADIFLGVPFNIASYSLLVYMIAQVTGLEVGEFIHTFGDAHIYLNHLDQVNLQLSRTPYDFPTLKINKEVKDIFDFKYEDFEIVGYQSHAAISAPISK